MAEIRVAPWHTRETVCQGVQASRCRRRRRRRCRSRARSATWLKWRVICLIGRVLGRTLWRMKSRRRLNVEGFVMLVSRNVKRLRCMAGLTATEAAKRGGLALRTWQKIEAGDGNTTMLSLAKVCVGLGVEVEELFAEPPRGSRI